MVCDLSSASVNPRTLTSYIGYSWDTKLKVAMESLQREDAIQTYFKSPLASDKELFELFNANRLSLDLAKDLAKWKTENLDLAFLQDGEWLNRTLHLTELVLLEGRAFIRQDRHDLFRENVTAVLTLGENLVNESRHEVTLRVGRAILDLGLEELQMLPQAKASFVDDQKMLASIPKLFPIGQVIEGEKDRVYSLATASYRPHEDGASLLQELFNRGPQPAKDSWQNFKSFFGAEKDKDLSDFAETLLLAHPQNLVIESLQKELSFHAQKWQQRYKQNPYRPLSLEIRAERLALESKLKDQLGESWPWVQRISAFLDSSQSKDLKIIPEPQVWPTYKHFYASTVNPMGRLFVIFYLQRLEDLWTPDDVGSLKLHLTRLQLFQTWFGLREFKRRTGHLPQNLNEMVLQKIIAEVPKDYLKGQPLRYSPQTKTLSPSGVGQGLSLSLAGL